MTQRTCGAEGCTRPVRAKGLCSTDYNRQYQPDRHRKSTTKCTVCGKPVLKGSGKRYRPVCSTDCRWFLQFEGASCAIPPTHPAHPDYRPPQPRPKPRIVWVAGRCRHCTQPFIDRQPDARYCSKRCGRRYHRRMRKGEVPEAVRLYVLERDGWRCQICRRGIPALLTVPHHKAGTADHVIPRSQGGSNDPANLRAAHFICNTLRGNRGGGEQLALIG